MVTKQTFKKQFPDIKVQKLETKVVLSHRDVEDTVLAMCESLGVGLVSFERSGKRITVYTSDKMKNALDGMKKGAVVLSSSDGITGTVMSDKPFICGGELCVRVDFGNQRDEVYSCADLV